MSMEGALCEYSSKIELIHIMQRFMTVPPEIASQTELLQDTIGATRPGQAPEGQVCRPAQLQLQTALQCK